MTYGRPMKGATRRIPITVHTTSGMIDAIDAYASKRCQEEGHAYSRSDFWNEAAEALLRILGRWTDESENGAQNCSQNEKKA